MPAPDSPESSPSAVDGAEAARPRGPVKQRWEDGTVLMAAIFSLFSLVCTFFAVHFADQHRWADFGAFVWFAVVAMAIGLVGMKFPSLWENREPETVAEAAKLMPKWTQKPGWRQTAFWAWLTWALLLSAGAVALGVRQEWLAFAGLLWAAVWFWVRFAYALKGRLPPPDLPSGFP